MSVSPRRFRAPAFAVLSSALLAAPATGQSAGDIFREALDRYQAQTETVAAYTLVQDVMGFQTETRFERREVEGMRVFVPVGPGQSEDATFVTALPALADAARLDGTRSLANGSCHALIVDDLSEIDMGFAAMPDGAPEFEPRSAEFCVDTESYLMRVVTVHGTARVEGQEDAPMTMRIHSDDYREVDGLHVPFRTRVEIEGMNALMGDTDAAEMQEALAQAREAMENMPAAQRQAMEGMLEEQMKQLEAAAQGGPQEMTMVVSEVRVEKG